jgi:hypothetical protein
MVAWQQSSGKRMVGRSTKRRSRAGAAAPPITNRVELRVHGTEGLRVSRRRMMPTVISGNSSAVTIMIAEKASGLIRAARCRRRRAGKGGLTRG